MEGEGAKRELLRRLPQVGELSESGLAVPLLARARREFVVAALRRVVDGLRSALTAGEHSVSESDLTPEAVVAQAHRELVRLLRPTMRRAINATGIILHTGLGRAHLSVEAVQAIADCARATPVEVDADTGARGSRHDHCEALLTALTGAEAALVVNNNAAACLLALDALASGKEVLVARGHQVEIGGSFRMPEVIAKSGARLVDVGTSNRVYRDDFARAITENTGAILDVHTSNYRITGFVCHPSRRELSQLARSRGIALIFDAGSGALFDAEALGLPHEPRIQDAVADGCDVVCFSGDKLLGGPQAGIAVGRKQPIERMKRDPLARAVRVCKLTLAALQATLAAYIRPEGQPTDLPAHRMIVEPADSVRRRAEEVAAALADVPELDVAVVACTSQAGSGSLPDHEIESWGLQVRHRTQGAEALARRLRQSEPAVFMRISDEAVLLDMRTVEPWEAEEVVSVLAKCGIG